MLEDNIDARLSLASLLLEDGKQDEAITLLSPPKLLGIFVFLIYVYIFQPLVLNFIHVKMFQFFSYWLSLGYSDSVDQNLDKSNPWWLNEKIIMKLFQIYRARGMPEDFIATIFPLVHESLSIEALRRKVSYAKGHFLPPFI